MKRHYIPLALLFAAFLFPPADYVSPATEGISFGSVGKMPDTPETRLSQGFVFIGSIGGRVQIRYVQWLIELVALSAVTHFMRGTAKSGFRDEPAIRAPDNNAP